MTSQRNKIGSTPEVAVVSDTGPLIWLAKFNMLHVIREIFGVIAIPEAVFKEAVTVGLEKGYDNAKVIQRQIGESIKIIKVREESTRKVHALERKLGVELGSGERESLALCLQIKVKTILTNDRVVFEMARRLGLEPHGILYILKETVKEGMFTKEEAIRILLEMVNNGLWIAPHLIAMFMKEML